MKKQVFKVALAITASSLFGLGNQAVWADDNSFSLTTGFDYSSGKYGSNETTDITSIPVIASYGTNDWLFKLTVPYVTITGPGNVAPGIGKYKNTTNTQRTTESGLGDIVAGATYSLFKDSANTTEIDLTGKVKFGTADQNKGLGTGQNDYSTQVDMYKYYGDFTAMGTVGYKIYGDTSATPLKNVFFGSIGGTYKLAPATGVGLVYDYRPAITSTGAKISEVTAFVNHKINNDWKAQAYAVKGFSDGSPDYGVGALISYTFK